MSKRSKWIWAIAIVLIIVVLGAAAFAAGSWFGFGGRGEFGMMGRGYYGHMQPFDRHDYGFRQPYNNYQGWGMGPGIIFGWLIGLGILALAVVGVVSLFRGRQPRKSAQVSAVAETPEVSASAEAAMPEESEAGESAEPISGGRTCAHCGKPAQADWTTCPYCGSALA